MRIRYLGTKDKRYYPRNLGISILGVKLFHHRLIVFEKYK